MYTLSVKRKYAIFFLASLILISTTLSASSASPITVTPDKLLYNVGDSISVTGTATPNAYVTIQLYDAQNLRKAVAQTQTTSEGIYIKTNLYTFTGKDKPGDWKVTVYDSVRHESSEAIFTLSLPAPPVLTLTITPEKAEYKAESIIITVAADQQIKDVKIYVTQNNSPTIPVTATSAVTDGSRWSGTYNIAEGYDGNALIEITAEDTLGNKVETSATFKVDTVPPKVTISAPSKTEVETVTVTGTVDDPTISSIQLSIVPGTPIIVPVKNMKWSQEVTLTSTGTNTIIATAIDAAENEGKASTVVIFTGTLEVLLGEIEQFHEGLDAVDGRISALDGRISALDSKISNITLYITIAVILSLIAAIFSIFAVVTIKRMLVLK